MRQTIFNMQPQNNTNISGAIDAAIADLRTEPFDQIDMIIVADGEDNCGMNPEQIRQALDETNIRLYAILLGVQNEALRQCANVYQIVDSDLKLDPPVFRQC